MNETEQLRELLKEAIGHIRSINAWYINTPSMPFSKDLIEALMFADRALPYATLAVTEPNGQDNSAEGMDSYMFSPGPDQ